MTVSETTNKVEYAIDGVTANFAVPMIFFGSEGLYVYLVASDGTRTLQTEGVDYDVSGGDGAGGTVMFNTPPDSDDYDEVEIYRWHGPVQETDYQPTGKLPVETIERNLDYLTVLVQQCLSRVGGSDFDIRARELLLQNEAGTAWVAGGLRLTGLADATDASDAVSKSYADSLLISKGNLPSPAVGEVGRVLIARLDALSATGASFEVERLDTGDIDGLGTAALLDTGAADGDIPLIGAGDKLATALMDTGTTDGKLVLVDSNDELPPALLPAASAAQMEAATVANRAATPANLRDSVYAAKAWGVINQIGTQSLVDGVGIGSISDEGTGHTRITLTDAMADANYIAIAMAQDSTIIGVDTYTASTFDIKCRNGSNVSVDRDGVRFVVFGKLDYTP